MALWVAVLLFFLFVTGSVLSYRAYFRGVGRLFLVSGIVLSLLSLVTLFYVAAGVFLVSSVQ